MNFVLGKSASMSEQAAVSEQEFGSRHSDPADPAFIIANLQQSANLANENCDRAVALAHELSADLREAKNRINQLEREADSFFDQLSKAKAANQDVRSNADTRVTGTIREAEERIARLKTEAENQIGRLRNELAQATRETDQVKAEADKRIECVKMEADARVGSVEADTKKRIDLMRRANEDEVLRLETELREAKNRADCAEQWLMLIRREIEDHLMPSVTAMRDGPKPTNSAARSRPLTGDTPLPSSPSGWFRRLWPRVSATAALGWCKKYCWKSLAAISSKLKFFDQAMRSIG